jgi:hypothetical protein
MELTPAQAALTERVTAMQRVTRPESAHDWRHDRDHVPLCTFHHSVMSRDVRCAYDGRTERWRQHSRDPKATHERNRLIH